MAIPPFQTFLDSERDTVFRFLVATVGPDEAEDCFQETFISALRAYPRLKPDSNLRAWVLKIAHRKALDLFRARKRRPLPVEEVPERAVMASPNGSSDVWAVARDLPTRQREALLFRFAADLPYSDLAEALGCTEEAARQRVSEAVRNLRKVMQ
ncbi:MAG TPA: sigma-70 family RNA polymerase sigma factor [Thermoleophilaceae bacterium]|nr:sigma-70 family RNA polymerase sigma factor [Thermoleophilaceae bacterium]